MTKAKTTREPDPPTPDSPAPGPIKPRKKTPSERLRALVPAVPLSILQLIDRYARDKDVDPAKYRAILDMQKEVQRDEFEREFTRDYNRMIPELPRVDKDGMIVIEPKPGKRGQRTSYATLNNIKHQVWPILARHHFGFEWYSTVVPAGEHGALQHVKHGRLTHDNGVFRESSWPIMPETTGSKNDAQARGSGSSYAMRYTLLDLVPLVTFAAEDRDDDGTSAIEEGSLVSKEQAKALNKAIKDCGVAREAFEQHYGPPEKLPLARYDEAMARCKQFKERMGETKDAAA